MRFKKNITKFIISAILFFTINNVWAITPKLADIEISNTGANQCQVVLAITSKVKYKTMLLNKPERLVVDLYNTDLVTANLGDISDSLLIKAIRTGTDLKTGNLRLIFDLNKPIVLQTTLIEAENSKLISLVLDLTNKQKASAPVIVPQPITAPPAPKVTIPQQTNSRDIVIVVDPGHGGEDPGAIGIDQVREKDVILAISKDLAYQINQIKGYRAVLTRDSDYFIPLRGRLKIARENHADMFVAVHADFYNNPAARGATVFALSTRGATSEAARYLAKKENESELGHVIADKDQTLQSVLINLTQSASISSSLEIGGYIMQNLNSITKLHHKKVEQAAFVVLKNPEIPSLLVETGFVSNAEEEKLLINPDYQQQIAAAIAAGIEAYFNKRPPLGTLTAGK
jgi:N-acetylmuramoyl-L-alanine amidase